MTYFILKVTLLHVLVQFLELKSLSSEPVNRTRNELLLDVFSQLIVEFKTFLDIRCSVIVVFVCWCLWWREEVEEGFCWNSLLNNTGLLCV